MVLELPGRVLWNWIFPACERVAGRVVSGLSGIQLIFFNWEVQRASQSAGGVLWDWDGRRSAANEKARSKQQEEAQDSATPTATEKEKGPDTKMPASLPPPTKRLIWDRSKPARQPASPTPRQTSHDQSCKWLQLVGWMAVWAATMGTTNGEPLSVRRLQESTASSKASSQSPSPEWILQGGADGSISLIPQQQPPQTTQRISLTTTSSSWVIDFHSSNVTIPPENNVLNIPPNRATKYQTISVQLVKGVSKVESLMFMLSNPDQVNLTLLVNDSALPWGNLKTLAFSSVGVKFQSPNGVAADRHLQQLRFDKAYVDNFPSNCSIDTVNITNSNVHSFPIALLPRLNTTRLHMENVTIADAIELSTTEQVALNRTIFTFLDVHQNSTCPSNTANVSLIQKPKLAINRNIWICIKNESATDPSGESSSAQEPSQAKESSKNNSDVTTVAIVLGVVGGLVLVVGCIVLVRRRTRRSKDIEDDYMATSPVNDSDNLRTSLLGDTSVETTDKAPVVGGNSAISELEIPQEEVVVGQKLGAHGLSRAEHLNTKVVMLKVLKDQSSKTAMQEFDRAVLSFVNLRHSNVINFIGLVRFDATEMGVLVEYMQKGSLRSLLANPQVVLSWKQRLHIAQDLCRGLTFVQSTKTARRVSPNLCAQRVFCDNEFNCKLNIFDYGMPLSDCITPLLSYGIGIMAYRAPEVLVSGQTSEQSQIYALGVIFYELSSRIQPYHDMMVERGWTMAEILISQRVASGELKPEISGDAPEAFQDLTARCLSFDPNDRPSLSEISSALTALAL